MASSRSILLYVSQYQTCFSLPAFGSDSSWRLVSTVGVAVVGSTYSVVLSVSVSFSSVSLFVFVISVLTFLCIVLVLLFTVFVSCSVSL